MKVAAAAALLLGLLASSAPGTGELVAIELPRPDTLGGRPLMQCLKERRSRRRFRPDTLRTATLSNLLWAAFGTNRSESGKRTAPSAANWQATDIYVCRADGVYRYDALRHTLIPVLAQDVRPDCGRQEFTATAPVNLVYVADFSRIPAALDIQEFYSSADVGFISQNVYLFCSSEGLATVVLGFVDKAGLAYTLGLKASQRVILTQPVGLPGD
jgi:SagB-type dehydrogenase family enzyme